jgi:predicted O-methyltransferase YrrM
MSASIPVKAACFQKRCPQIKKPLASLIQFFTPLEAFMKQLIAAVVLLLTSSAAVAKDYLLDRIPESNFRYSTFQMCLELLEERNAKTLVETGTSRCGLSNCAGDGCSTIIFADFAKDHGATFYSVDIDPSAIKIAKDAVTPINPNVQFANQDSIVFLKNFNKKIDFLYLDSYDFVIENPDPSQQHHLKEVESAYPFLHEDTIIMIDDCGLPHGGKGKLVIEFLTNRGWMILMSAYQTILIYPH